MCARIKAAVDARSDDNFLIIARSDEVFNDGSLDEAISRGRAYAEAGADAYMCLMASRTRREVPPEDYARIVAEVPIPFVDINVPVQRATEVGVGIDIFTGPAVFAAAARHRDIIADIRDTGGSNWIDSMRMTWEDYTELVLDGQWMPVAKAWQATQSS
jgi:methylisocitrate lyase